MKSDRENFGGIANRPAEPQRKQKQTPTTSRFLNKETGCFIVVDESIEMNQNLHADKLVSR